MYTGQILYTKCKRLDTKTSYLWITLFFLSLGSLKLNINWHSWTTSLVQNNFMKNWLTTISKLFISVLFSGHASRPYNNEGMDLVWMSYRVISSDAKRSILPKISLAVLWNERLAWRTSHLNDFACTGNVLLVYWWLEACRRWLPVSSLTTSYEISLR